MVQHRRFSDLALDDEGLHTPDGTIVLASLTRAELVRNWSHPTVGTSSTASPESVIGGALIGGALAGPAGLIGGGLLGSTVSREKADAPSGPRVVSASLIFESPTLAYSTTIGRDRLAEADAFVAAVKAAAGV